MGRRKKGKEADSNFLFLSPPCSIHSKLKLELLFWATCTRNPSGILGVRFFCFYGAEDPPLVPHPGGDHLPLHMRKSSFSGLAGCWGAGGLIFLSVRKRILCARCVLWQRTGDPERKRKERGGGKNLARNSSSQKHKQTNKQKRKQPGNLVQAEAEAAIQRLFFFLSLCLFWLLFSACTNSTSTYLVYTLGVATGADSSKL